MFCFVHRTSHEQQRQQQQQPQEHTRLECACCIVLVCRSSCSPLTTATSTRRKHFKQRAPMTRFNWQRVNQSVKVLVSWWPLAGIVTFVCLLTFGMTLSSALWARGPFVRRNELALIYRQQICRRVKPTRQAKGRQHICYVAAILVLKPQT